MGDTFFVIAHFHFGASLLSCLLVTSLVAYAHRSLTWPVCVAWVLMILNVVAASVPWSPANRPGGGNMYSFVSPSHRGWPDVYVGSAVLGLVSSLLGLVFSLFRTLRTRGAGE